MTITNGGDGDGYGFGYGFGYGDGSGSGYSDGFGSGYSDGYGFGFGGFYDDGEKIATVGEHGVFVLAPWSIVRVGCQTHRLDYWAKHWKEIAIVEYVEVSETEAREVLAKARKVLRREDG